MVEDFNPRRYRVAVLAGGKSGEREVSLASGEGALKALEQAGFNGVLLDPAEKEDLKRLMDEPFDVAFLCLHGKWGEDGTMQGFLDLIGLPYTCSGVWSSALAMDKPQSKRYYRDEGIPTPPAIAVRAGDQTDADEVFSQLGHRCVVKPGSEGSALGVFIVEGRASLEEALEKALALDDEVLIERYIKGMELTVAVLGNEDPEALPVIEIVPKSEFYDFESKYAPGGSQHVCPARLSVEDTARIQDFAVRAHKVLGCRGVSRSDFILEEDGSCWILETNTIPGMTETSLLPDAARAAGISFPQLCTKLVELALS